MIGVDKIDDIRRLGRAGATVASIARATGVSEPTVRKYLKGGGPLGAAPGAGRGTGVADAGAVRGADRLVARRGQALLPQAAPHRAARLRQAGG